MNFYEKKQLFDELKKILEMSQLYTMISFSYLNDDELVKT